MLSGCSYYVKSTSVPRGGSQSIFAYMKKNGKVLDYLSTKATPTGKDTDVLVFSPSSVEPYIPKSERSCTYSIGLGGLIDGKRINDFCASPYTKSTLGSILSNIIMTPIMGFFALSPTIFLDKVINKDLINEIVKENDLSEKVVEVFVLKIEYENQYGEKAKEISDAIADTVQKSEKQLKIIKKPQDMGILNKYLNYDSDEIVKNSLQKYSSCLTDQLRNANHIGINGLDFSNFKFYNDSFQKDIDKVRKSIKENKFSMDKMTIPDNINCSMADSYPVGFGDVKSGKWSLSYKVNAKVSTKYLKKNTLPIPIVSLDISDVVVDIDPGNLPDMFFKFEDENLKITPDPGYKLRRVKISNKTNNDIVIQSITLTTGNKKISEPSFPVTPKNVIDENIKIFSYDFNKFLDDSVSSYNIENKKDLDSNKIKLEVVVKYTIGNSPKIHTLKSGKEYKLADFIKQNPIEINKQ